MLDGLTIPSPDTYRLGTWLFLRLLGVVHLCAFASLLVQIRGLAGERGILPARAWLERYRQLEVPFWQAPTLFRLRCSDRALLGACVAGVGLSLLLVAGVLPVPVLLLLWALYLSLLAVLPLWLGYQWDALLVEATFVAVFVAPWDVLPSPPGSAEPEPVALWLLWWLAFRLMFSSGAVKLRSGDPTWRDLTAMAWHYETQPLPTWTAWLAHHAPRGWHRTESALMFVAELGAPFLIFLPPPFRTVAFVACAGLMVVIGATGNYGFFNVLGFALCVPLLDDATLRSALVPIGTLLGQTRWINDLQADRGSFPFGTHLGQTSQINDLPATPGPDWPTAAVLPVAALLVALSLPHLLALVDRRIRTPAWLRRLRDALDGLRLVSPYGLFAVMTTTRPEIVLEGSRDGVTWLAYECRYKPGDPRRRPRFCAPHMPRLDWQLWFAALSPFQAEPWVASLLVHLLDGTPAVLRLLGHDPFAGQPPKYVRAVLYQYRFSDWRTLRTTGAWWTRERLGLYAPAMALAEDRARAGGLADL